MNNIINIDWSNLFSKGTRSNNLVWIIAVSHLDQIMDLVHSRNNLLIFFRWNRFDHHQLLLRAFPLVTGKTPTSVPIVQWHVLRQPPGPCARVVETLGCRAALLNDSLFVERLIDWLIEWLTGRVKLRHSQKIWSRKSVCKCTFVIDYVVYCDILK